MFYYTSDRVERQYEFPGFQDWIEVKFSSNVQREGRNVICLSGAFDTGPTCFPR